VVLLIEIDGSYCEGGGQILRTAVALAGVTGKETRIFNIRASRDPPGLKRQHLTGILAAVKICNALVEGAEIGSKEVVFRPDTINSGKYKIDIGTAGSVTLLLQTLVPITIFSDKKIVLNITGGTNVQWSPSIDYYSGVFLYFLKEMGIETKMEILRYGFYPKGGGKIRFEVLPWKEKKKIDLTERGEKKKIKTISVATHHLKNAEVAERQIRGFRRVLSCEKETKYVDSYSIGSSITGTAHFENSRMGSSVLGERGKKAEIVGREAAEGLKKEIESNAVLDKYMGDQIIPYLGLVGGKIKVSEITDHLKSNIWVTEKFLPVKFKIKGNIVETKI
jgi:RNA 3'-terminal phosphate cyclase (GTP)